MRICRVTAGTGVLWKRSAELCDPDVEPCHGPVSLWLLTSANTASNHALQDGTSLSRCHVNSTA